MVWLIKTIHPRQKKKYGVGIPTIVSNEIKSIETQTKKNTMQCIYTWVYIFIYKIPNKTYIGANSVFSGLGLGFGIPLFLNAIGTAKACEDAIYGCNTNDELVLQSDNTPKIQMWGMFSSFLCVFFVYLFFFCVCVLYHTYLTHLLRKNAKNMEKQQPFLQNVYTCMYVYTLFSCILLSLVRTKPKLSLKL